MDQREVGNGKERAPAEMLFVAAEGAEIVEADAGRMGQSVQGDAASGEGGSCVIGGKLCGYD